MNDSGAARVKRGRDFGPHRPAAGDAHDLDDRRAARLRHVLRTLRPPVFGLCRAEPGQVGRAHRDDRRACSARPGSRASSPPCSPASSSARSFAAFSPTASAAGRSSPGRFSGTRRPTSWWRCSSDAAGLNFWRLISGIGLGVEMVTIGAYLSELAPKGLRGRAFAVNQAIGFVCVPVVSFLAYMLVPTAPFGLEGWRWVVLIGALAAPVVVFLRRGLPESPRWLAKHGRLAEADRVLSAIEAKVEAEYGRPLPPPGPEEPVSPASGFRRFLGSGRARPRHPDERLQHLSDDRILRLQQLGPLAARQAGDHRLDQPRLYDRDRACGADRAAARILSRRPVRAQMDHRRCGGRHSRLRPHFRPGARFGAHRRHGGRADARRQHHVVQLPRLPAGAVPDRHSRPRRGLRLFLEPALGDFLAPSSSPSCSSARARSASSSSSPRRWAW